MKCASLIALSLLFAAAAVEADGGRESEKQREVPAAFRGVDFRNFSYPLNWDGQTVRLKDGKREFYEDKIFGNGWFDLSDVGYADLTGDGAEEAVVDVSWVACGASCDGGSHLFYFYSIRKGRPKLLWRIETGSIGYGCGLKSFAADARGVTLEVFKDCRPEGASLVNETDPEEHGMKFRSRVFTRLHFRFENGTFALKRREVFPNPREDVRNYPATVRVGDE